MKSINKLFVALLSCSFLFGCSNSNVINKDETSAKLVSDGVQDEISAEFNQEIKMVENLFSLNYKEIFSEYPNAEGNYYSNGEIGSIDIAEKFAGISGNYNASLLNDGTVYSVIFEPADESIVDIISASLGDYVEYDSEWDSYTWNTDNIEVVAYIGDRIFFYWIGEELDVNKVEENDDKEVADDVESADDISKPGVVKSINTAFDIPDELMNDEFKNVIDLFSKPFSQSGLDINNGKTFDNGESYIFYFENLKFLGKDIEKNSNSKPRIIYKKNAIDNDGTPSKICFGVFNHYKSNGYDETVEMVENIADALGIADDGLIDNDYSSSSRWAIGDYATFTFPNLNLALTVSNTTGYVELVFVPIN